MKISNNNKTLRKREVLKESKKIFNKIQMIYGISLIKMQNNKNKLKNKKISNGMLGENNKKMIHNKIKIKTQIGIIGKKKNPKSNKNLKNKMI